MTAPALTREEFDALLAREELLASLPTIERWLERGDGAAVYRNVALDSPELGAVQVASFGSPGAQLEVAVPPEVLPDIGGAVNWRYRLEATYRGAG